MAPFNWDENSSLSNFAVEIVLESEYLNEKNVWPLGKSLGFYSRWTQTLREGPNSSCQNSQKVLPCKHFYGVQPLAIGP
jgi:hypothetical protein